MTVNIQLLIARRRNVIQRDGDNFVASLNAATGLVASLEDIIDPQQSVVLEMHMQRVGQIIQQSSSRQADYWKSELEWEEITRTLSKMNTCRCECVVIVALSHYWDFALRMKFGSFVERAKELLEFDRDTVEVFDDQGCPIIIIDQYTSEISGYTSYAVATSFPHDQSSSCECDGE